MLDNLSWSLESSPKLAPPVTVSAVPASPPSSVTARTPLSVTSSEAMVAAPPTSKVPPLTPTASPAELASVPVKRAEIGRASWRERGGQYGYNLVVAGDIKNKNKKKT